MNAYISMLVCIHQKAREGSALEVRFRLLLFRQKQSDRGCAHPPGDLWLRRVGVVSAGNSSPVEADAESIRAAILLDELESSVPVGQGGGGRIIVEVKTLNALAVLQYSCSIRVMALHTGEMNARRCCAAFPPLLLAAISTCHVLLALVSTSTSRGAQ